MTIYYLRVVEVSSLIVPKSRCWQDYAFSWGFRGESIPCIFWLPKSSSILWVLGHITPTSIPVIRFPSLPLLPPFYKDYYGYVGLTGIIQDNFPISISLMSAKSFLSHKEAYSQVPAIRMWSSLGGGALFCLPLLLWTWFCQPLSTSSSPSSMLAPLQIILPIVVTSSHLSSCLKTL